jgi:hypothetical protein
MKALIAALALATLGGAAFVPATPARAQAGSKVLVVYGIDPCPTSNGEELVVCARKPESERYRIPEELRESAKTPAAPNWAERAKNLEYVGSSGTNSCSPDGSGGWTGCWAKLMREARAERKAEKAAEPVLP